MPIAAMNAVSAYFTICLRYVPVGLLPTVDRPTHHGTGRLLVQLGPDPRRVGNVGQNRSAVLAAPRLGGLPAVLVQPRDGGLDVVHPDADVRNRRFRIGGGRGDFYKGVAADLH